MWRKISDWIRHVSKGWVALSTLVIFILFTALVLPGQSEKAKANTGADRSPDMSFYYSAGDLYQMAESYGDAGRETYVRARFTFDLVWPLVYTVFLITGIGWVGRKAFTPDSPWQRMNLVPLLGILFDYLENIATSLVMVRYPVHTPVVDALATVFTMGKWIFISVSFALLLAGAGIAAWRWMRGRRQDGKR